jgi:hypothetical protein
MELRKWYSPFVCADHKKKPANDWVNRQMAKGDDKETREISEESAAIDREVLDVIRAEKRKVSGRGPRDPEAEGKKKKLAEDGLRAIKVKDARVFTELLRQAGIPGGSPEWKNARKAFYSA